MAYNFNGSNQYLTVASAPATAAPITIAAWFRKSGTATKNGIFLLNAFTGNVNDNTAFGFYFGASSSVRGYIQSSSTVFADFAATGSYTTNSWGHACVVFATSTSRTIYRNGENSATSTSSISPANIARLEIASFNNSSHFDGQFAEIGIWNAALTANEVVSLSKGFACNRVRPQSLIFYLPLIRTMQDLAKGVSVTNNNTATVADHSRVYA